MAPPLYEQDLALHLALCLDDNNTLTLREKFCTLMILLSVQILDSCSDSDRIKSHVIKF